MNRVSRDFAADYETAFVDYLNGGDEETALQHAYELGRRAIAGEQSILGLIGIHYHLLQSIEAGESAARRLPRSEAFLTQVLALFEMTHRQTLDLNRSLRDSEQRKAAILGSAFDSIITFDVSGHVIEFNPAAEQKVG